MGNFWSSVIYFVLGILLGGGVAFFLTRNLMMKQIKDNPPVSEKMIRAMFLQMGRKPSETQIRQIMKSMGQ